MALIPDFVKKSLVKPLRVSNDKGFIDMLTFLDTTFGTPITGLIGNVGEINSEIGTLQSDVGTLQDQVETINENIFVNIPLLGQTISDPPTQVEVQAISDKVDALIGALIALGFVEPVEPEG